LKVYVTGDTHCPIDIKKLNSESFPEGKTLTKDDIVIILGDFGLLWKDIPDKEEKYWTNWLNNKPWTTLFVDGNHENHNRLKQLPEKTMFGGKVGEVSHSIFHLKRGEVYTFNDKKVISIGGAMSTDKQYRRENISWWKEELLSYQEENYVLDQIQLHRPNVILSHTCPTCLVFEILNDCSKYNDPVSKFFNHVLTIYEDFEHWYFGHFHKDITYMNFTCCYNSVKHIS
jgi:hypothetical protein